MLTLLRLFPREVAAHRRAALLVSAIGEVLAGHADDAAFLDPQVSVSDEIPFLHEFFVAVKQYSAWSTVFGNCSGDQLALESQLVINGSCADHDLGTRLHQLGIGETSSVPGVESCTRGFSCHGAKEACNCHALSVRSSLLRGSEEKGIRDLAPEICAPSLKP